jgi:hypothetical protein
MDGGIFLRVDCKVDSLIDFGIDLKDGWAQIVEGVGEFGGTKDVIS